MIKFRDPLEETRTRIVQLQNEVELDAYFKGVPSIEKKKSKGGFYFHATDDPAEVRKKFFEFIRSLNCSCEAVVGRKIPSLYQRKHNGNESEFYADMLAHLLKNKFQKEGKLVLNIAQRGKSTRNSVLEMAKENAAKRFTDRGDGKLLKTEIVFNIQNHFTEPLLNVADYFCWALQRVFERGETRYYDFLADQIPVIIDLYDQKNYENWGNYYGNKRPLTVENRISPPVH